MQWTFLTNHSHVLLCLKRSPDLQIRHLAEQVGITERAVHRIICELREGGFLSIEKRGRRNHYEIHGDIPLRHPLEEEHTVGELLDVLTSECVKRPNKRRTSRSGARA